MTIPTSLIREIFGHDHARELLLLLGHREEPVRYSEARRDLDLHPQQFQRALDRLEDAGLLGLRAPDDLNKPHTDRNYYVFLELTGLGSFCVDLWERINAGFSELARERGVSERTLAAATGSE